MAENPEDQNLRLALNEFNRARGLTKNPTEIMKIIADRHNVALDMLKDAWTKFYLDVVSRRNKKPGEE